MMKESEKVRRDTYQRVTDLVVARLEAGEIPWSKPWVSTGSGDYLPANVSSGRAYTNLFNILSLQWARDGEGRSFGSRYWITYRQAKKLGGQVRKGEKSSFVIGWRRIEGKADPDDPESKVKSYMACKASAVFNVGQVDGLDDLPRLQREREGLEPEELTEFDPVSRAEAIVKGYRQCPPITHGGNKAYYAPLSDEIGMPERRQFKSAEGYYSTLFHEMTHSTGHTSRLNRKDVMDITRFGDHAYAREELTAEIGSSFLMALAGLDNSAVLDNSAAYLKSWLRALKDDKKLVIMAAQRAGHAVDMIAPDVRSEAVDVDTDGDLLA